MAATSEEWGDRAEAGRVKRGRSVRIVIAALAAVFVVSAGAVAVASTTSSSAPRGHRIHIVTVLTSAATNSAGLGGPGDVVAQVFSFELSPGVTGHIDASVQLVSTSEQLSHVAFVFPHGQIDAQAAIALPPTNFTAAITGGTGAYEGVGGEVVNTVISRTPLTVDRTLYLIYPDQDD
jgi:hypothetical protein